MAAGDSARYEAEISRRHAIQLREAAKQQERRARSFDRGSSSEQRTAELLAFLEDHGFRTLHDRSWPGSRRANIDHIVVGPSGVFVIDTKDWSNEVTVVNGHMYRGDVDCLTELDKVRAQAEAVRDVLAEVCLAPSRIHPVIALHGRSQPLATIDGTWIIGSEQLPRDLVNQPQALSRDGIEVIWDELEQRLPRANGRAPGATLYTPQRPQPTTMENLQPEGLFSSDDLVEDALKAAEKKPLAEWMVFLHPEQIRHTRRELNGPGKVTGPAGTGKTVLALHRLAHLAEKGASRLLYVTFTRNTPKVVRAAYRQLSPYTSERVEFSSIHQWAMAFLRSRRIEVTIDPRKAGTALARAWSRCAERSTLERIAGHDYWKDEIEHLIRGRGMTSLAQYLDADRPGRGIRLGHQQRRVVWSLAEDYQRLLSEKGIADWNDILRLARDEVRREAPSPAYEAVVLDEAQDMSQIAAQLLYALVGDRPNGLLFLGDDNQRVYASGFRPSDCGIDVVGRSVRLNVNYRNTKEILTYATNMTTVEDVGLLDDLGAGSNVEAVRSGPEPVFATFDSQDQHDRALLAAVRAARIEDASDPSFAVLCEGKADVAVFSRWLEIKGIPVEPLTTWEAHTTSAVLVGTIKRSKGLEFNRIFMPSVAPELLTEILPETPEAMRVNWRRRRRELVVGFTRSRSHLWIGAVVPPADRTTDVIRDPIAVDPEDTSVAGVIEAALGLFISGGPARFATPGWNYDGRAPELQCDTCGDTLNVCRRGVVAANRQFKEWALVCPACQTAIAPDQLSLANQRLLASFRHVR